MSKPSLQLVAQKPEKMTARQLKALAEINARLQKERAENPRLGWLIDAQSVNELPVDEILKRSMREI